MMTNQAENDNCHSEKAELWETILDECAVFVATEINFDSTSETLISFSSFAELRR